MHFGRCGLYADVAAGMGTHPTAAERTENAFRTVRTFWETYGAGIQAENEPGTFKHNFVQEMGGLHEDMTCGREQGIVHRRILDILGEQKMCMIQFESCLDEFNMYLTALRLLDTITVYGDKGVQSSV